MVNLSKTFQRLALLALLTAFIAGCGKPKIQNGSTVSIHYTLTVDGQVVESSWGKEPLTFVQGSRQVMPGLEEQLAGLKQGDRRQIVVAPEKGYGPVNPQAVQKVPKKSFKDAATLKVGGVVNGQTGDGRPFRAVIVAMDAKDVTLDLNHPLAGKTLQFSVEVMDVKPGK